MRLLIVFLLFALLSCHAKKPLPGKRGHTITDKNELADLTGTWYATPGTYIMLKEKRYKPDSIYIVLQPDSVFKAYHLPDCMTAATKNGLLKDAIGTWRLHKDSTDWKLGLSFEAGRLFRYKTHTHFDIAVIDSLLTIYQYIGDPAKGEALLFQKRK